MYYRKQEDIKKFSKKSFYRRWWQPGWYFSDRDGYYKNSKKDSNEEKFWKNYSNRLIRRNKNDYYLNKSNNYRKEFEYWWTLW